MADASHPESLSSEASNSSTGSNLTGAAASHAGMVDSIGLANGRLPGKKSRLPGYQLTISPNTELRVSCPPKQGTYASSFVTAIGYEHLLIRIPPVADIKRIAQMRSVVRVCYVHEGAAYRFDTRVNDLLTRPVFMLALEFPDTVLTLSSRRHERYTCSIPARIIQNEREMGCYVVNISESGCLLKGKRRDTALFDPDKPAMLAMATTRFNDILINIKTHYHTDDRYHRTFGCEFQSRLASVNKELALYVEDIAHLHRLDVCDLPRTAH